MNLSIRLAFFIVLLVNAVVPEFVRADAIKDELDRAKNNHRLEIESAEAKLKIAFADRIKSAIAGSDLASVESLTQQQQEYTLRKKLPSISAMRGPVAEFEVESAIAEAKLRKAYENALSGYTKAGRIEDAQAVRDAINHRFQQVAPTTQQTAGSTTQPTEYEQVLASLESAKAEFVASVQTSHAELVSVIDARAKTLASKGDLDGYEALSALSNKVKSDFNLPSEVKDTAIRNANARFVRNSEMAFRKMVSSYQTAIRDYTKMERFDEARAVKEELGDGGWFEAFTRETHETSPTRRIDLMPLVDLQRDVLGGRWKRDGTALSASADHNARLILPYQPPESYDFIIEFTKNTDGIVLQLVTQRGEGVTWTAGDGTFVAFEMIDGKRFNHPQNSTRRTYTVTTGERHRSVVKVRKNSVEGYIDGKLLSKLETDFKNVDFFETHQMPKDVLGVIYCGQDCTFHKIELVEVNGRGRPKYPR